MPTAVERAKRGLFIVYLLLVHAALIYLAGEKLIARYTAVVPIDETAINPPTARSTIPAPPSPVEFADLEVNSNTNTAPPAAGLPVPSAGLIIPVLGVKPDQLTDTFTSSRSEGRSHDAIDIAAPAGTPVIAAASGEIARFWDSERGGITIYQYTADRRFMLYYAHLQRRADGLQVGAQVTQGATIGYVGDTGNAGAGNTHLHFSVSIITDPKRFWEGTYVNPYPLLRTGSYPQTP